MEKFLSLSFDSSITDICELNSSFDSAVLKIAYHGKNRNNSYISKETFERCAKTMFLCPVVCNYDRATDTLGGHDVELYKDADGVLQIVAATTPVGVVPNSARYWWEECEEEDGSVHEYLFTDVVLWKRQEAYKKIKKDGITKHSMEITVKDYEKKDGIYYIKDFEFTAFALIGVEPCFEGSSLEVFTKQDFKREFAVMIQELKSENTLINTTSDGDDIHPQTFSTEGGKTILEEKLKLAAKYNIDVESLDFSIDDMSIEELEAKFASMVSANEEGSGTPDDSNPDQKDYALTSGMIEEIRRKIEEPTIETAWDDEFSRYIYIDSDFENFEVYVWDITDWLLYGFKYSIDGDNVIIDFESKKRKKFAIVDFDEGEQASPIAGIFEEMEKAIKDNSDSKEWHEKYDQANAALESANNELSELRAYKAQNENEKVFANFEDLAGLEEFEALKNNSQSYTAETLLKECYAIRGKNASPAKFSYDVKPPKLIVGAAEGNDNDEPYGDLFFKYGKKS